GLPVPHPPGMVAHAAPREGVAPVADLEDAGDGARLLVVGGGDRLREAGLEGEGLVPGREPEAPGHVHRLVRITPRGDVLRPLEETPGAIEPELPQDERKSAVEANRAGLDLFPEAGAGEAQEKALARQPDPDRTLRDLLVGTLADPRVERETTSIAAAEVERVRP